MSVNLDDANAGDLKIGDVGQNIYHGVSPADLRALMAQQTEFYMTLVAAYERQYAEFQRRQGALEQSITRRRRIVDTSLIVIAMAVLWLVMKSFL